VQVLAGIPPKSGIAKFIVGIPIWPLPLAEKRRFDTAHRGQAIKNPYKINVKK